MILALVVLLVVLGVGLGVWRLQGTGKVALPGPEGVPIQTVPDLAPAASTHSGQPIDGVTCRATMDQKVGYHIHVLVRIFVHGRQERLPAGAGIAAPRLEEHLSTGLFVDSGVGGCLYWLHVHSNDGIIHIESATRQVFTLGQFFDIWGQPLSSTQVGPARGTVRVFENGKRVEGDPRTAPLLSQAVIQLDVGTPVIPFQPSVFKVNGLCGSGTLSCSTSG